MIARRPLPQVPIQVRWRRTRLPVADRRSIAILVDISARFEDLANEAAVNQFHVADERRIGAVLRAMLDDSLVFLCRFDELPAFENVMAEGFFNIDVLARLAGPNGRQRVPVVWGGDRDGVDALVGERLTNVAILLWFFTLRFLNERCAAFEHLGVDIANRYIFGFILHAEDV